MFERIAELWDFHTAFSECDYKGCYNYYGDDSRFCDEHAVIGGVLNDIEEFLSGLGDPVVWKNVKRFRVIVKPLGEYAGLAVSPKEMVVSSSVLPNEAWRVFRHEFGHL